MTFTPYRGRLAPSPTGLLHLGHACTFWRAYQRAREHGGTLVLRNEDLDPQRSKPEYVAAMIEDLRWLGIEWTEGPDVGGPYGPYSQSECRERYLKCWRMLREGGFIYPCLCSRKDLAQSASAPHDLDDEPVYPGTCRCRVDEARKYEVPAGANWRFRVPDGEAVAFNDLRQGPQSFTAGHDFGDFVVWRRDDVPAYQLAVVADDAAMAITEVVRGVDLLKSTARQILLQRALRQPTLAARTWGTEISQPTSANVGQMWGTFTLEFPTPAYYHCDLLRDANGVRLAKRHDALSVRHLREIGKTPAEILKNCP